MTGSAASNSVAADPRDWSWRGMLVALGITGAISSMTAWPPALAFLGGTLRLLLPVEQFAVLVAASVASCAVVGWWSGGRLFVALGWIAVAAASMWVVPGRNAGYGAFVCGWAIALAAAFALVGIASRTRSFLGRALAAVTVAGLVAGMALAVRPHGGDLLDDASRMLGSDYQRRVQASAEQWQRRTTSPTWVVFERRMPKVAARAEQMASVLGALGDTGSIGVDGAPTGRGPLLLLAPALLVLESLLALVVGWALYHRLVRVRIGPPLAPLRALRFNDQLVWGLVVGATIVLVPTLAEWRVFGANLLCVFGSLYALRGAGVLTWWIPDRVAMLVPLALVVVVPLLGPLPVLSLVLVAMFGVGLGDTWRDFRADASARRSGSLR